MSELLIARMIRMRNELVDIISRVDLNIMRVVSETLNCGSNSETYVAQLEYYVNKFQLVFNSFKVDDEHHDNYRHEWFITCEGNVILDGMMFSAEFNARVHEFVNNREQGSGIVNRLYNHAALQNVITKWERYD